MKKILSILLASVALRSFAAEPTLTLGSKAPELYVDSWFNGNAVEKFEEGKIYVVEFWATWCGPCLTSIPHLNELQKKHAKDGVTFIGVAGQEQGTPGEKKELIESFLAKSGPQKIAYRVAFDSTDRTAEAWLDASWSPGIPRAFVVDKQGKIVFIGHPMQLDGALAKVVDGTWERDGLTEHKAAHEQGIADLKVTADLKARLQAAADAKDWDKVMSVFDEAIAAIPAPGVARFIGEKIDLLIELKRSTELAAFVTRISSDFANSAYLLAVTFHFTFARESGAVAGVPAKLGFDLAKQIEELLAAPDADPQFKVYFYPDIAKFYMYSGEFGKAIDTLKLAIAAAEKNGEVPQSLKDQLKTYQFIYQHELLGNPNTK